MEDLYANQALHGIEVINGFGFHKKALDWCVDKNLTVMGTSDIHNLIQYSYDTDKNYVHRTMTLVMAKENTRGDQEALDAGRTVAWASKYLAGKEENVRALFEACVELNPPHYTEEKRTAAKRISMKSRTTATCTSSWSYLKGAEQAASCSTPNRLNLSLPRLTKAPSLTTWYQPT